MRLKISLLSLLFIMVFQVGWAEKSDKNKIWHQPSNKNFQTLWLSIRESKETNTPVRILHIGDSHITNGFTTAPIQSQMDRLYGDAVSVSHRGINGATFLTYNTDEEIERILQEKPDLLIISLGTNDSYTFKFSPDCLRENMNTFLSLLFQKMPDLPVVLTSPPPNFLRLSKRVAKAKRKRGKRRYRSITSYTYNSNTVIAANLMSELAVSYDCAYIDLYATIGDEQEAKLWLDRGWMYRDRTHYTIEGYAKHGEIIASALVQMIEEQNTNPIA